MPRNAVQLIADDAGVVTARWAPRRVERPVHRASRAAVTRAAVAAPGGSRVPSHTLWPYERTSVELDRDWWRQAVVYQVYPRSFADSDGDGIGDLAGLRSRLGHVVELGADAVWLSPFYPSQLVDGGYDIDDHRMVDPRLGTLDEFDDLVDALHSAGIRLIVDIVPNHTSSRHRFFAEEPDAGEMQAVDDRVVV